MRIEDVLAEWKKDTQIDMTELAGESLNIAKLHGKYMGYLIDAQKNERDYRSAYRIMLKHRTEYYLGIIDKKTLDLFGWAPCLKKIIKTELPLYLESDPIMQEVEKEHEEAKSLIKHLEEMIKHLNGRGYLIKNALDWIKFQNGG